jgi:EmrB/QacA subfamily drug resistance transporter
MSSSTDARAHTESGIEVPGRWPALAVCLVAGFMTLLDVSAVDVALPSLRAQLHATSGDLQWVLSGYALAFGLVLVAAGRLGDAWGRRGMFIAGLAGFTLASAAAGLSTNPSFLLTARLAQGVAAGVLNPQIMGLIQQMFRGRERGKAFGMLGASIGLSTAIGPLAGGLLIAAGAHDGWRLIFFINVPIGVAALACAPALLPRSTAGPRNGHRPGDAGERGIRSLLANLDPIGVILLAAAILLILLPLIEQQRWHGGARWAMFAGGGVLLACFAAWEHRHARKREPLVDLELFRLRSYALGSLVALIYFAGFTAIFFVFTVYLQNGLGYSALLAGAAITPFAVGAAFAAGVGGRFTTRHGHAMVAAGLIMAAIGLGGVLLAVHDVQTRSIGWITFAPLLLTGLGSGLVIAPNEALTLADVPPRRTGSAAGVLQTGQRLGSSLGIALVSSVFYNDFAPTPHQAAHALDAALAIATGFVLLTLIPALADLIAHRSHRRADHDRA